MTVFVALLRGVNLGKRQLKMDDLRSIGERLGLEACRTFIASGNLLFRSDREPGVLKEQLEKALAEHMAAPVPVILRTASEIGAAAAANPFADAPLNRVAVLFCDTPVPPDAANGAKNVRDEQIALGSREIYVHYPQGIGASKLSIPAAAKATARNMNSVVKLAELAREMA